MMSIGPACIVARSIFGSRMKSRAYLDVIWNTTSVRFLIGGGHEGVQAVVNDAEKAGYANVFALIDRDFRQTNMSS